MTYAEDSPFYRLLATKYDPAREDEALGILERHPELAALKWPGPDERGQPFVKASTALHYAANDGKLRLMARLVALGADVNASEAQWYRSVLSWAANGARVEALRWLLEQGAQPNSLDALHAAAWGGSSAGKDRGEDYAECLRLLIAAGADKDDRRHFENRTALAQALTSENEAAAAYLRSIGASER